MRKLIAALLLAALPVLAVDLSALTNQEVGSGLKEALTEGVGKAVDQLSATDGFLKNAEVKIPLPENLAKAEKMLRTLGLGGVADNLVTTMNRAAESAVKDAQPILLDSLKKMTLEDAKAILTGPNDSATQYFRKTSGEAIAEKFLPKVQEATAKVYLADAYNKFAGPAARFGLVDEKDKNLDQYVTNKAVDGLFTMIAQQEKAIRADPIGQSSKLLQTVFGALVK